MNARVPVPMTGGVNLLRDAKRIADTELAQAKNFVPTRVGFGTSRRGAQYLKTLHTLFAGGGNGLPLKMLAPRVSLPIDFLVITRNIATYEGMAAEELRLWYDTNTFVSLTTDPQAILGPRPAMVEFQGKVYVFAGPAASARVVDSTGAPVFSFNGTGNNLFPFVAAPYRQRMAYFNFGPGYESYGVMSDDRDPATIGNSALGSRAFIVGARDGDRVVAAVEVMETGSAASAVQLILKEFSAYMLTGELAQSTDAGSFMGDAELIRLPFDCGCASAETVVQTPYGVIWASPDDVWLFQLGQAPRRIGTKLRPQLAATSASYRYLWHAEYFDGFYRLAIMSPGQAPTHDSPCGEQWWLDLREGAPESAEVAAWFGPQQYNIGIKPNATPTTGTRCMVAERRPEREPALYGAELVQRYANGVFATDHLLNVFLFDSDTDFDSAISFKVTGTIDVTEYSRMKLIDCAVAFELITKDYDFGDSMIDKLVVGNELSLWTSLVQRLQLDVVQDGGRKVQSWSEDVSQKGLVGGADALDTDVATEEHQAIGIYPSEAGRHIGKYLQYKLRNVAGYVVDADSNEFAFEVLSTGQIYIASVATGYYADLGALGNIVATAMNAKFAGSFLSNADTKPNFVNFSSAIFENWKPRFTASGTMTDANARRTRKLGALFGFATDVTPAFGTSHTAEASVAFKQTGKIDLGALNLTVRPFKRRPS